MSIIDRFFETIFARIKQLPKEEKKDERNIGGDDIAKTTSLEIVGIVDEGGEETLCHSC